MSGRIEYSPAHVVAFNLVAAPVPYPFLGHKRRKIVTDALMVLFCRGVFNGTGDTKIGNRQLGKILGIKVRRVQYILRILEENGQIKTLQLAHLLPDGPKTERYIRIPAAHAYLGYRYKDRSTVFAKHGAALISSVTHPCVSNGGVRGEMEPSSCVEAFLVDAYTQIRSGWSGGDYQSLLILGTEKGIETMLNRTGGVVVGIPKSIE